MSARDWQPGDVAMGQWPEYASGDQSFSERRIVRFDGLAAGWALASDPDDYLLDDHEWSPTETARPLVVIDPEDEAQAEAIVKAFVAAGVWKLIPADVEDLHAHRREQVAAALREFANPTPPKPEEPTGLGAVVRDENGETWVRCNVSNGLPWRFLHYTRQWADIDGPEVLSEGVTQ